MERCWVILWLCSSCRFAQHPSSYSNDLAQLKRVFHAVSLNYKFVIKNIVGIILLSVYVPKDYNSSDVLTRFFKSFS
jgi:hypothetical protein